MDYFKGKGKSKWCGTTGRLSVMAEEVKLLQEEIKGMMCEKEKESRAHERDMLVFAFKESEWKEERKKLKEEVRRLRKTVEENNEKRNRRKGDVSVAEEKSRKEESPLLGTTTRRVVSPEEMRAEGRLWRDEAVEKWKRLYLAIKIELDDLIQTTRRDGLYRRAENEHMIEELKMEVKSKEETIEKLKARLVLAEKEEFKRAREVDILRQSLRIIGSRKASSNVACKEKFEIVSQKNIIQEIKETLL